MENTMENKAKFFAQYWGQKILLTEEDNLMTIGTHPSVWHYDLRHYILQLKPLSQITDEDAIEVAKIINPGSFLTKKKWNVNHIDNENASYVEITSKRSGHFFEIDYDGYLHVKDEETGEIPFMVLPEFLAAFDFLRSKGYALRYMGISVEQQIEYNWIKLKP